MSCVHSACVCVCVCDTGWVGVGAFGCAHTPIYLPLTLNKWLYTSCTLVKLTVEGGGHGKVTVERGGRR